MFTIYDRMFGDLPSKNTVYTPYTYMVLANPTCKHSNGLWLLFLEVDDIINTACVGCLLVTACSEINSITALKLTHLIH